MGSTLNLVSISVKNVSSVLRSEIRRFLSRFVISNSVIVSVHENHPRSPHSSPESAGARMSPLIDPLPLKKPKISS